MQLPRQPAGRAPASEQTIFAEAREHSRRLGKTAIDASNVSWKHDEMERTARLAPPGTPRRDAFAALAALNASYAAPTSGPSPASRFHRAAASIASTLAHGTVAGLVLFGLAVATRPTAAEPVPRPPILSPAEAAQLRALMLQGVAAALRVLGDEAACTDSAVLIHPLWHQ